MGIEKSSPRIANILSLPEIWIRSIVLGRSCVLLRAPSVYLLYIVKLVSVVSYLVGVAVFGIAKKIIVQCKFIFVGQYRTSTLENSRSH